jgi:diguanylate cyclase (GGDEF)-like protein/PAS domain S-box-containing protein
MSGAKQSAAMAATVLNGVVGPACVLDEAGTLLAVNDAWREFGAANGAPPSGAAVGLNYFDVLVDAIGTRPSDEPALRGFALALREVLAGRRDHVEITYECHSPTMQRWFSARAAHLIHGGELQAVIVHTDITAQTLAVDALRRGESLLQDLAAAMPGALFRMVRRHDEDDWHFAYLSPGIEALFGVEARRVRGHASQLWNAVLSIDREAFDVAFAKACEQRSPWSHEFRIGTPSGEARWLQVKASLKFNDRREPVWTGALLDISDRQRLQAVLRESQETFRALFETVPQGIVYQSPEGLITAANPAAQRILGLGLDQLQGRSSIDPRWRSVHEDGSDFPGEEHPTMEAIRTGRPVTGVVMGVTRPDGEQVWILVDATPLFKHGKLDEVYVGFEDITERVALARELKQQASTDYLTGVANRRVLMEHLKSEFERVRRHPERACSVVALDLDHFKEINDSHGHAAGDAVLVHLAQLMQEESRAIDIVARSGGEEFTLLLPDTTSEAALVRAERLRERIAAATTDCGGLLLKVTISLGVSTIAPDDPDSDAVLARADRALYEAKYEGRNSTRVAPPP